MSRARVKRSGNAGSSRKARSLAGALEAWFEAGARPLLWRGKPAGQRDAYVCLVVETMAQQTQISRVVERLPVFLKKFPTVLALARSSEDDVVAAWQGMGYYRRARNLHAAARMVVERFGGELPRGVDDLLELPGVGRYTAGAIASMAFGDRAPIVDGNVARVLLRIEGRDAAADDREATRWLWERAAGLVEVAGAPGVFNEALMELGATVCLPAPARPACGGCPWKKDCVAHREGREIEIPRAKKAPARGVLHCGVAIVTRADGAVLIEQRPRKGMWAGMWQAPTVEMVRPVERRALAASIGLGAGEFSSVGAFVHQTTHRELRFEVFRARVAMRTKVARGDWTSAGDLEGLAFSNAQRKALRLAASHEST